MCTLVVHYTLTTMTSRCECVVKRTGQVCAKPTTGFSFQKGTPVCGLHTGRPRRRPHNNNQQPIKKEDPPKKQKTMVSFVKQIKKEDPPPPPPHSLQEQPPALVSFVKPPKKQKTISTQTELVDRFPYFKSVLSWIVVLTTLLWLNPPTETSFWTQKMLVCFP